MENFSKTELENEKWKDIEGYDGMYQVSDLGRVRSKKYGRWKVRKQCKNCYGYLTVSLSKDSKESRFLVHRLVAQAFIPNDDESKTIINHRNSIRDCNRVENLEWCDYQYNNTYNDIHLRHKQYIHPKYKRDKVKELYEPTLTYEQNIEIFKANGIECCRKTVWKLRKDLNLKGRSNWKRNEIKDLYNPNLSIAENIELFRANGIECCRDTVCKLRKDLGIIKNNSNQ